MRAKMRKLQVEMIELKNLVGHMKNLLENPLQQSEDKISGLQDEMQKTSRKQQKKFQNK